MNDRIVAAFHRIASLSRADVFGPGDDPPVADAENAQTAAPGWVGEAWAGALLLVANFPGGGSDAYAGNPTDDALYASIRAFRESAAGPSRRQAFSAMCEGYREAERTHRLWQVVMQPVLEAAGIDESQAAFLNLVPFRIRGNRAPRLAERTAAWTRGVGAAIEALAPQRIAALGVAAGDALGRFLPGRSEVIVIPRTNGDRYLAPGAAAALARLRSASGTRS